MEAEAHVWGRGRQLFIIRGGSRPEEEALIESKERKEGSDN